MAIDNRTPKYVYYYTDYETFKLILQYGTLRFKESTTSNDLLDTKRLYDRVLPVLEQQINNEAVGSEGAFLKDFTETGHLANSRVSLVACFTEIPDSRMLWDAYTMHRKGREGEKYNGVCLEIDTNKLSKCMEDVEVCDYKVIMPIMYGDNKIDTAVELLLDDFTNGVRELQKDADQSQDIIQPIRIQLFSIIKEFRLKKCLVYPAINLIDGFDKISPFCKHSFWREEKEIRAVMSLKRVAIDEQDNVKFNSNDNGEGYYYLDLPISQECISKIILGPEFSEADLTKLKNKEFTIQIDGIKKELSEGTGVIINR